MSGNFRNWIISTEEGAKKNWLLCQEVGHRNKRSAFEEITSFKIEEWETEPIKRKELGEKGIPLFLAKINFPKWLSIPNEFQDEAEFETIANEIKNTYQNRNYRLQGEFINNAVNVTEYKEKYIILNNFERQCEELEQKKFQYEEDIRSEKQQLTDLKLEAEKQRLIIERECLLLEEYRNDIVHYEKLKDDNKILMLEQTYLTRDKTELEQKLIATDQRLSEITDKNDQLETENTSLISQVNNQLEELNEKGLFKKIYGKKRK